MSLHHAALWFRVPAHMLVALCTVLAGPALAQKVALFVAAPNAGGADSELVLFLELDLGYEVVQIAANTAADAKHELLDSETVDAIIVSESVASGDIGAQLNDRPEPIIVQEPFVFDDMLLTGASSCTGCFASDDPAVAPVDFGFSLPDQTEIDIVAPGHPIAELAGLADTVAVYQFGAQLNWGHGLSEDAEVVAVATNGTDSDGDGVNDEAVLFVYEAGDVLVGGESAAGMRIGAWVHNSGGEFTLLTEEGRELWQSMLEFALDAEHGPGDPGDPEPPVEFEPRVALFLSNPAAPAGADGAMIAYLEEELATEVILLSESLDELTKLEQLDDAEVEAIIISESVTSGNIGAQLNERPEPILVQESFVFDDMFLTGLDSCTGCFAQDDGTGFIFDFGFTSATETQVDITNPDHPILVEAGLADTVDVYSAGGQLHWGYGLGEGAQVLAVPTNGFDNDEDGANDGAVLFVYEADAPLVDGEPAAGMRIGTWVHNSASEFSLMTEDGLALWDATVRYALGLLEAEEPGVTFRRGDNDGNGVVDITDPISSLGYQFLGTFDPPCLDALDWDDNGSVEITDPIGNLTRQFLGGPPAAAPGSEICGVDPTTDAGGGDLGCESYPPCAE